MDVLNKLPTHLWTLIFQQLDKKSLSASTQTCEAWYDFIFGSTEIIGKFTLRISSYDRKEKYFVERFGCNFKNVKICKDRRDSKKLHLSFRQTGSIMESIENVENLCIDNVTLKFWQSPDFKIEFPHLKSMKLGDVFNGSKVFVAFQNVQVQELKLPTFEEPPQLDNDFRQWFSGQKQLKSLECYSYMARFVIIVSSNLNFKLKKIGFSTRHLDATEKLKDFFKSQDELKECEVLLDGTDSINNIVLKSLLDIELLKKLQISSFYNNSFSLTDLNADNSVETFIDTSYSTFEILIERLPKLKHYKCVRTQSICSNISKLSINCHMLEDLEIRASFHLFTINDLFSTDNPSIKFIYLKEMTLTNVYVNASSNFWKTLTSGSPLVEKLSLHFFNLDDKSLNYMCENWRHFRTLALGCGFYTKSLRDILCKSDSFSLLLISPTTFSQFDFEHAEYRVQLYMDVTAKLYIIIFHHFYVPTLRTLSLFVNVCDYSRDDFNVYEDFFNEMHLLNYITKL